MNLYSEFQKFNIDAVGVCSADLYNKARGTDYKVCIVALFPYFCGYPEGSNLSIYTHGRDYHLVTREVLSSVAQSLKLERYEIHADIGPEIERSLAAAAGLAFVGRNQMAINEKYGSYFFIGYIACDADLPLSQPCEKSCLDCRRCINACPGAALGDSFNPQKCLSEITQKKGTLADWEKKLILENKTVFGCDICQRVCPHNEGAVYSPIPQFTENRIVSLEHSDLAGLTNKTFKEKYGERAFSWRGKAPLLRNLEILMPDKKCR